MVKVSVIIPVYNAQQYLKQCLDSICQQTLHEIEIICIDDGSTDDSLRILQEYTKKESRLQILTQKNQGAGAARNCGLRAAKGLYLSFLDADDFFEPNMLEEALNEIETYKADFIVFDSDQYHMDTDSYVKPSWVVRYKDIPPYMPFSYRSLTDNVFKTFVGWAWDKLYRKSFIDEHGLWFQEQRTSNDLLFVFSALVLAKRIAVVNKVLAHQRRGGKESLSVTREKSWHCFYDALIALRKRLQDENIYWELEQDFINYALHFSLWNLRTLAAPTKQMLQEKLCNAWFNELGISKQEASYFYNKEEYKEYLTIYQK